MRILYDCVHVNHNFSFKKKAFPQVKVNSPVVLHHASTYHHPAGVSSLTAGAAGAVAD